MNRHLGDVALVHIPERRMHEYRFVFVMTDFAMGQLDRFIRFAQKVLGPIAEISIVIRGRDTSEIALNFCRGHIEGGHGAANDAIVDILHGSRNARDDQHDTAQCIWTAFVSQHHSIAAARHRED